MENRPSCGADRIPGAYVLDGTLDEILAALARCLQHHPRREPGRLRINGRSFEFADLHSFYHQAIQIFKAEIYGFKPDRADPVIIDGGAHIGLASLYFAQKYPQSKITAFEADPAIAVMLRHNLASFECTQVDVHAKAVWVDESGVGFKRSGDDSGHVSPVAGPAGNRLPSIRLRSILSRRPVDLLKLDIEGAEFDVIRDCRDVLSNAKNAIVEIHRLDQDYGSLGDLFKVFEDNHFQYTLGDLHAADWLSPSLAVPFTTCRTNKYIVTLYAWQADGRYAPTIKNRSGLRSTPAKARPLNMTGLTGRRRAAGIGPTRGHRSETLKVVHLSTQDYGGAGKAAYRLHKGLAAQGIDSTMLVINKSSGDDNVKVIPDHCTGVAKSCRDVPVNQTSLFAAQAAKWDALLSRYPNRPMGLEMFSNANSELRLDLIEQVKSADIINLHWVAGLMDTIYTPRAIGAKPVVWTLHDMNPFTGGCHYAQDCRRYLKQCGKCYQLGSTEADDASSHQWIQKAYAYESLHLNIVAPSRWLKRCAAQSALFHNRPVHCIPNGVPTDIYRPYAENSLRQNLKIPEDTPLVLFGADSQVNTRKGLKYLLAAITAFAREYRNIALLTFGGLPPGLKINAEYPVYSFGRIGDETRLAQIYSAADVFVIPSLEDNLPNTVLEAMACGTPVLGFQVGGIPDMVESKRTGYLVAPEDTRGLIQGLGWILSENCDRKKMSRDCRETIMQKFDLQIQARAYTDLYQRVLPLFKPIQRTRSSH
jgi:FkbM family methyltransferase